MRVMDACFAAMALAMGANLAGCAVIGDAPPAEVKSSYACQSQALKGQAIEGQGDFGCYFQLRQPGTNKLLAHTPYELVVFTTSKKTLPLHNIKGTTDEQGRSVYVRTPFPIAPSQMHFFEIVGEGTFVGGVTQFVHPIDGRVLPGNRYRMEGKGCEFAYEGVTDEQGYTVQGRGATACKIEVSFFAKKLP